MQSQALNIHNLLDKKALEKVKFEKDSLNSDSNF